MGDSAGDMHYLRDKNIAALAGGIFGTALSASVGVSLLLGYEMGIIVLISSVVTLLLSLASSIISTLVLTNKIHDEDAESFSLGTGILSYIWGFIYLVYVIIHIRRTRQAYRAL